MSGHICQWKTHWQTGPDTTLKEKLGIIQTGPSLTRHNFNIFNTNRKTRQRRVFFIYRRENNGFDKLLNNYVKGFLQPLVVFCFATAKRITALTQQHRNNLH